MKPTPISLHLSALLAGLLLCTGSRAAPSVSALEDGPLGLHERTGLQLSKGECKNCPAPPQALWYFRNELIATPSAQSPVAGFDKNAAPFKDIADFIGGTAPQAIEVPPALIWLGSPEVIPSARLDADGKILTTPNGESIAFDVVPKIATNLSYYNEVSRTYLAARPLRLRGETVNDGNGRSRFVARTVWPLDFAITPDALNRPLTSSETLKGLVKADNGGADKPFASRLLWERRPGSPREWDNHAVLGVMLNGAQGDDDEAHGGHFAISTGRYRSDGDWSRWMVYNFYNLDSISEKGIIAAPTPMDKYLFDLNNGQSWYRPSYMLVAVLKHERVAQQYQAGVERLYNRFYRHDINYNHSRNNCAGLSLDTLKTLGWNLPERGHESLLKAIGAYLYVAATSGSLQDGRKIYDYLLEESTRLYPASTFDALGEDLLALVQGKANRSLSQYEQLLAEDVEAIYYVHIPQLPSSRTLGLAPVYSFGEYMQQAPADRSQWKIIPTEPRPFPDNLRDGMALHQESRPAVPLPVAVAVVFLAGLLATVATYLTRWFKRRRAARAAAGALDH